MASMRRIWDDTDVSTTIAIFSVCALVFTLPAGVVMGLNGWWAGWLLILLTVPVVTVLSFLGYWVADSDRARLVAGVIGWSVGVAAGLALLVSGIDGIVNYEPDCVPSDEVECRWLYGVADAGEATVAEQKRHDLLPVVMYQVIPGALLLLGMAWWAIWFVRDRRSAL